MRDEIATTMRLLGVTKIDQLGPHLVSMLDYHMATSHALIHSSSIPRRWTLCCATASLGARTRSADGYEGPRSLPSVLSLAEIALA